MNESAVLLNGLKSEWLEVIEKRLTKFEGVRTELEADLLTFFDQLIVAMDTNSPMWIDTTIASWAKSASQSQPLSGSDSMVLMVGEIMAGSLGLVSDSLSAEQAVALTRVLMPFFVHAIDTAANQELQARLAQTHRELQRVQNALARVDKSKSDFISVAAHELKTPLTLIEGYNSMMHEALSATTNRRLQSALCIKGITAGTKRLHEIVDDMIDVSMIDNNLLILNYQPVWINRICLAVQRDLDAIIQQRQLSLTIKNFPGSNDMIFADGERIYQAVRNIIVNAVKYTPDGGAITVDGRALPGFIEVLVTDTGIGIDPEDHQRIFEKFGNLGDASLHSSGITKFKGGGPGLGLPITKGIIEAHGGAIWVESEGCDEVKCPGSIFHIMIPSRKSPPEAIAAHRHNGLTKEERVLYD